MTHDDDDGPMPGDWIECWNGCDDGLIEGTDPFWDLGEWRRCDVCNGRGGWICEDMSVIPPGPIRLRPTSLGVVATLLDVTEG